jgi:hypothetical protein
MQQPIHLVRQNFTNSAQLKGFGVLVQEICMSSLQNSTRTKNSIGSSAREATVPHLDVEERVSDEVAWEPRLRRGRAGQHGVRHWPRRAVPVDPPFLPTKSHSRKHLKNQAFK